MHFPEGDTLYLSKSAHDITFSLAFREASIVPADLALFAPRVKGLTHAVTLHGAVGGTLDSLYFDHIAVRYNNRPLLEGNVSAVGLPDLNNPYLRANLTDLSTVYAQFRPMLLRKGQIVFSHVGAQDGVAKVYRVDSTEWNYQFLTDAFKTDKKEDDTPLRSLIAVRDIRLDNLRLQYEDLVLQLHHSRADLHHFTEDSIDAQISQMAFEAHRLHPAFRGQTLEVEELQAHVVLNDTALLVPTLTAQLPRSRMDLSGIEVHFPEGDTLYLSKSAHDITFSLAFREATRPFCTFLNPPSRCTLSR